MRIAVTGASGYIGGHLTRALTERGHVVHDQDVHATRHLYAGSTFDLADEAARREWLEQAAPELVVHLAARYGRVWCEDGLIRTAEVNAGLTAELARDCAARGIRVMYVSSSEVYGATATWGHVTAEDAMLAPLNMYGLSKKWGEEACRAYAPGGLVIARLNMPYGPAAVRPLPGATPHHSGRVGARGYNAMHTMLWQAAHGMPVTAHQGTERCFTWIGDAMRGLVLIAESGEPGTWNVCRDDDPVTMTALARRCVALAGSDSEVTEVRQPGQVTQFKRLDGTRLRQLGWKPAVDLDEGMRETLEFVRHFDKDGVWRDDAD